VVVPGDQTCCGALHAHAGLRREAKALARRNVAAFAAAGCDFIVTDSAGCGAALRETGHLLHDEASAAEAEGFAKRVRDVSEVLARGRVAGAGDEARSPPPIRARPLRVGYHDPCHLAHGQGCAAAARAAQARSRRRAGGSPECRLVLRERGCLQPHARLDGERPARGQARCHRAVGGRGGGRVQSRLPAPHGARRSGARHEGRMAHLVEVLGAAYPPASAT
jgi:glycolate oxidase iron-sulfur subunit